MISELIEQIAGDVRGGTLRPGSRLPTEREFAERFGVSRAVVRRALAELEGQGYIVRSVGRGTFVAETSAQIGGQSIPALDEMSPGEVTRARRVFEPGIAALAAISGTKANFQSLSDLLEQSEAAATVQEFDYFDGAIHLAIADATQNNFLRLTCTNVQRVRSSSEWGRLKFVSVTPERRLIYEADHRRIVTAIIERDGRAAARSMSEHLDHVLEFLFSGNQ